MANQQQLAQTGLTTASTRHTNDLSEQIENPAPASPEYDYVDGPHGKVAIQKGTTNYTPVTDAQGNPLAPKATVPTNEFEAWQAQNPTTPVSAYWEAKAAAAPEKAGNKDDKAIAIMSKPPSQRTQEETSYLSGYDQYIQKNKLAPAQIRANVMMQMPTQVADPNNPGGIIYTTRAGAIGKEAPGSADTQAAKATEKYFTSGKGGQTLAAFNTVQSHLAVLAQASDALHNGNLPAFNKFAQEYAKQTGSPAPTNFDAVKNAVKGETARALTGNVTVSEQAELDKDFNNASSPAQIHGVAQKYIQLMDGKKQALHQQYTDGMSGKVNFDSPQSSDSMVTMKLPDGRTGSIHASQVQNFLKANPGAKAAQ